MSNLTFTGNLDQHEVFNLLNITDIFVHPSTYPEGLPSVILEAGLHRCAVIATDAGGTGEIILDKDHGLLLSDNSAETLVRSIKQLAEDPEKRLEMGRKLHNHVVENFDRKSCIGKIITRLERMY